MEIIALFLCLPLRSAVRKRGRSTKMKARLAWEWIKLLTVISFGWFILCLVYG
jgi:hypothetical protein